ncbi:MAG: parA [Caulobacteraceae bacterium]|jgi:chromosome partitioning protein|nr:parA [Caulobacteraceae bacterium]
MPTIAFVSSKGGVGKTTSALLLALGLAERGHSVALVDSDPNLPLKAWGQLPGRPDRIKLFHAPNFQDLPGELRGAKAAADWVVIDTEGGAPRMGGLAIANADLVITPLAASQLDAREAIKVAGQVAEVSKREQRTIPLVCLFARTPSGVRRSFHEVRTILDEAGIASLAIALSDKEAFRALFFRGGALGALNRRQVSGVTAAKALVEDFTEEVSALLR